jgi:hypothetical protein
MVTSEKYLQAENPIVLRVDERDFNVEPLDFDQGLRLSAIIATMASEYNDMLSERPDLVTSYYVNDLLDQLLGMMRFNEWKPDWLCRSWIKRRVKSLSIVGRVMLIGELSRAFWLALLIQRLATLRGAKSREDANSH